MWALTRRKIGVAVNRKRVLRVMREQGLIQRRRSAPRRRRPGSLRVERPGQLWHMDMASVWVAEHGWCYPNAIIDCCTREIRFAALAVVEGGLLALVVRVSRCPDLFALVWLLGRPRRSKELEILFLRHELAVLRRQASRPKLTRADRTLLASLSRSLPRTAWAGFSVNPETLLRWHRPLVARG